MIRFVGRLIELIRPVTFGNIQSLGTASIQDSWVEVDIVHDRVIIFLNCFDELSRVDAFQFGRQFLDRIRGNLGDLADMVFVAQFVGDFLVENLPAELVWLS